MSADIVETVQSRYAKFASSNLSSEHAGVSAIAQAFGYTPEELAAIPAEANMGLSCGNPTAFARLRPGETVVDLGCGGGLDVLLAAPKVGPNGKAIGIDMTPEMIDLARRNAVKQGLANVEFHLATIDRIPLPDASADCIVSNCVINLAPDKPVVSGRCSACSNRAVGWPSVTSLSKDRCRPRFRRMCSPISAALLGPT